MFWWWILVAFVAGANFGVFIFAALTSRVYTGHDPLMVMSYEWKGETDETRHT